MRTYLRTLLVAAIALAAWGAPTSSWGQTPATETPTETPTPTATPTRTPTFTPTHTFTPTATFTPVTNLGADRKRVAAISGAINPGFGERLAALWHGRQSGGALSPNADNTKYNVAAGVYMVEGVRVIEDGATAQVLPSTVNTSGAQYRKATICVDASGAYHVVAGAVAASQDAALKSECPYQLAEVGYLELPTSFTATSTSLTSGMCKQSATTASQLAPLHQ